MLEPGWSAAHVAQHGTRRAGCKCGWKGGYHPSDTSGRDMAWLLAFDHRRHLQDVFRDMKAQQEVSHA